MQKKYERASLIVTAEQYELDKGLEDGFELYTKVITNGWISTDACSSSPARTAPSYARLSRTGEGLSLSAKATISLRKTTMNAMCAERINFSNVLPL